MTLEQKLDHFACLLRFAEYFKNDLLINLYQRKIELINKELAK